MRKRNECLFLNHHLLLKAPIQESDDEDGFGKLQDEDIKGDRSGGSSTGADLEDVKDDWYDEDGNLRWMMKEMIY